MAPGFSSTTKISHKNEVVQTDLLIIGAGPAGASLACFLGKYGLTGIMLAASTSTADTPRAHITNMGALECLRDIGLEPECKKVASTGNHMQHTRWCESMAGEEYARAYSWGNDPHRAGDYDAASPCSPIDIPQTVLEPILINYATHHGFQCRFNTSFLSFERESGGTIRSKIQDNLTGQLFEIRSKYLFGCDGSRSQVLRQMEIPFIKKPGQGVATNVLVKADLSHLVENRVGNLHWIMKPDEDQFSFGWNCCARMIKPWNEWIFILFAAPGTGLDVNPSPEECLSCVKRMIGDDSLPVEVLNVSKWFVSGSVAEYYSEENIFCLGDAVHRHSPCNGLGSNTCIQDAYNLAWKIAYVLKGKANPQLLDSYSVERQPVGESVINRAGQGLFDHIPIWDALGMMDPSLEVRKKYFHELSEATAEGVSRRLRLQAAIRGTDSEFHGLGVEMNQRYISTAIFLDDEEAPRPPLADDAVTKHEITTYPGSRLPHAWLNTRHPGKQFSTIDLAGNFSFCVLTGIGGEKWKNAASKASRLLDIEIRSFSIGWGQDYEDVYFDWAQRREIEENGCLLIRPDRFVAWRSKGMIPDADGKLLHILKKLLGR